MKFEDLITKIRGMASKIDVTDQDFLAVQVNITDDNGGCSFDEAVRIAKSV